MPISNIYKDGSYIKANSTWHREDSPWKSRQIKAILDQSRIKPSSFLEVGCGAGDVLKEISELYPDAICTGFEPSPQAVALWPNPTDRLSYRNHEFLAVSTVYDCLLCIDVFEHVEDYIGFIRQLKGKANYKIFHIPLDVSVFSVLFARLLIPRKHVGHLHYFTRETALATLQDCGYEIVDSFYTKSFDGIPCKTLQSKIARIPRKLLFMIAPHLAVRLLGGCSFLVLAK